MQKQLLDPCVSCFAGNRGTIETDGIAAQPEDAGRTSCPGEPMPVQFQVRVIMISIVPNPQGCGCESK